MLKYKCLVLDHDDTVVQTERHIGYPYFKEYIEKNGVEDVQALVNYSYRVAAKYGNASASLAAPRCRHT